MRAYENNTLDETVDDVCVLRILIAEGMFISRYKMWIYLKPYGFTPFVEQCSDGSQKLPQNIFF
jgi:hypothetical protein